MQHDKYAPLLVSELLPLAVPEIGFCGLLGFASIADWTLVFVVPFACLPFFVLSPQRVWWYGDIIALPIALLIDLAVASQCVGLLTYHRVAHSLVMPSVSATLRKTTIS